MLAAALLNIDAVAARLTTQPACDILLVCAGTFREVALEDVLAAGMLVSMLPGRDLTDAAQLALASYRREEHDLAAALRRARNGRALIAKYRTAEIDWCARTSAFPLVAEMDSRGCVRTLRLD